MASFPDCVVCKQPFRLRGPDPYLLPCLHAVCETCLTSDTINCGCSVCQEDVPLRSTTLQKDRVRQRLILHLTAKHRPTELLCTHKEDGNQAVCWCQQCEEFLCEHCQSLHEEFKVTRKHVVLGISELGAAYDEVESYCSLHPKYVMELFDKDCGVLICLKCKQGDHAGHSTDDIDTISKSSFLELQSQVNFMKELQITTLQQLTENTQSEQQLEESASVQRDKINNTFDILRTLIDQRQKEIALCLDAELQDIKSQMLATKCSLELNKKICSDIIDYSEIVLGHACKEDLQKSEQMIKEMIDTCLVSKLHKKIQEIPTVCFVDEHLPQVQKVISTFARISVEGKASGGSGEFSLFSQSTGPSFSTLAAQGDASGFAFKKDESKPFHWSVGRPLFGSASSPVGQKADDDDDYEVVPSDDIDFKPITDLPDLVEVKTGEEDWEVVYCQRSKLYRFVKEVNQWKERAVGEMKILKQNNKYRLLMRRDQVHKVACNHLISPSMKLKPMATSETAWCWIAQDYAENEPKVEQFALRFKTVELAKQFKEKFEECQEQLSTAQSDSGNNSNNSACTSSSQQEKLKTTAEVGEEEETEDEEEEDSDEENIIIFEKRATLSCYENNEWKKLGLGNLKIMYNEDLNGNNIEMEADDGKRICNHVICREHTIMLEKKHKACMWSPIDFSTDEPVRRNFKALFSSVAAAEEFVKTFNEGVSLARDADLSEKISLEMDMLQVMLQRYKTRKDNNTH